MGAQDRPQADHSPNGTASGTALKEAGVLLIIALAAAAVSWALRADRLPLRADPTLYEMELDAPLIDPGPALKLYDAGQVLFVDTRPVPEASLPTIPGAAPIRAESFDDDLLDLFDFLAPEDPLILFGDGNLPAISTIAARLQDRGYHDIRILRGGIQGWVRAGGPVTAPSPGRGGT